MTDVGTASDTTTTTTARATGPDGRVTVSRSRRALRLIGALAILGVLGLALWLQRATVSGAVEQIGTLSGVAVVVLLALCFFERWSRADIVRRLLGPEATIGAGLVIHDVGNAVSKGVPLGGALGTAVRWQISRDRGVAPERFATMLVAYGIATTFASWLLPFGAVSLDLIGRRANPVDIGILVATATVLVASAGFWTVVLRSHRLEGWAERRLRATWRSLARRVPAMADVDPAAGVATVRRELLRIGRRPWSLLGRTLLSQACGAFVLLVALRSLGVGPELGMTEFFRVFFVAHLLGTFAPTPGGVGVVEAGVTGALVAAGVDTTSALAAVLVYRLVTYVMPIALGATFYAWWRFRRRRVGRPVGQQVLDVVVEATERGNVVRVS